MNLPRGIIKLMPITILALIGAYLIICFSFYQFQERLVFFPEKLSQDFVYTHPDFKTEFALPNKNGGNTNVALFSRNISPDDIVVYFHGNAHNIEHYSQFINPFLYAGKSVLIIDYQTFGKSTGKITPYSFYEDVELTIDLIKNKFPSSEIIVYGKSLGTGLATYFASKLEVNAILLETPYTEFKAVVSRIGAIIPTNILLKYRFSNIINLNDSHAPVYIFHGEKDWVINVKEGLELDQRFADKSTIFLFPEGSHNDLTTFPEYHQKIQDILENH